jgi:excisionase family DNA binding protein
MKTCKEEQTASGGGHNSEYVTVREVTHLLKYSERTIYNKIHKKEFRLHEHFVKPTPKKILFKRSAIMRWLEGDPDKTDSEQIGQLDAGFTGSVIQADNKRSHDTEQIDCLKAVKQITEIKNNIHI